MDKGVRTKQTLLKVSPKDGVGRKTEHHNDKIRSLGRRWED